MKRKVAVAAAVSACVLLALAPSNAQAAGPDRDTGAGVRTATLGTGYGINVGTVPLTTDLSGGTYLLKDPTRGNNRTIDATTRQVLTDSDNIWGDDAPSHRQSAGVDAQFSAVAFWDYFKEEFGRQGIRDDGVGVTSVVHYGTLSNNAFWDDTCFCISYGDGDGLDHPISLDIAGHELTHGLTSFTAGLGFSGEPGDLNESTSDVFGTMVEWYENLPADVPDYTLGEMFDPTGDLRWMDRPSRDGVSPDCWSSAVGGMDVHYGSGVGDHFFYLLAEGSGAKSINGVDYDSPTCNGATLTGIGRDSAAAIWYRALTDYLTSTGNYRAMRAATLAAAADLYGSGSPEYSAVSAAWSAVNVT